MQQTAQVIRVISAERAEVKVQRVSACASAHNCGSCDHCSFMEHAPEVIVEADNPYGAKVGDLVTVESATSNVLGAAVLVYIVPFILFFLGYSVGMGLGKGESLAIAFGCLGFAVGLVVAVVFDRYRKRCPTRFWIVSIKD